MFKKVLFFSLTALLISGFVACKKNPPPKDETRTALREGAETVNTDVLNTTGGKALLGSQDILGDMPLFIGSKKTNTIKILAGGKKAIPRIVLSMLNDFGPWDTLAGKWRWNAAMFQWEHYSTTPSDSILFEWVWIDSLVQSHNCLLAFSNYQWTQVGGEDALIKLMLDLRVDNTSYFSLNLKEVAYGTTMGDVRKIDAVLTVVNVRFTFVFDYTSPPTVDLSFRLDFTNADPWYQINFRAREATPPFGDSVIAQNGTYTDYKKWKVTVDLDEPDAEGIQLIDGEITKGGTHAAYIKSEKRYENGYPYLYVWLEYPDGSTETPQQLFSDLFPQGSK